MAAGAAAVVGYEANGGFLTAGAIRRDDRSLAALPTRDAVIVPLALLLAAREFGSVSRLVAGLPARFTASDRVKDFPMEIGRAKMAALLAGGAGREAVEAFLAPLCGRLLAFDATDGVRMTFENGHVVHFRPSGNAPEFRCYVETEEEGQSRGLLTHCMQVVEGWKEQA
jgi:phosphomannomutase